MIDTARLAALIPGRRWFGGKGRTIESVDVLDHAIVHDGPPALTFALLAIVYADGGRDLYHAPLLLDDDGSVRDAADEPHRLAVVGDLMAHGHTIKGVAGSFHFGGPGLDPLHPPGRSVRALGADQSNTSLVLDDAVVVKLFRRVEAGPNPDLEINRLLTHEGFEHTPPQVGEIVYEDGADLLGDDLGDEPSSTTDLAIAQQFVGGADDGWRCACEHLHDLYRDAGDADDVRPAVEERAADILGAIEELGRATADLHVTLAREELEPSFAPEAVDRYDLQEWSARVVRAVRDEVAAGTEGVAGIAPEVERRAETLVALADAGQKTRVHGDFHLGQALYHSGRGWFLIDFEGEPARSFEDRRAKQSPLRDVAGMLRSLHYASTAALFDHAEPGSDEWRRLEPWADAWDDAARDRFLGAYLPTAHGGSFVPSDRDALKVMLDVFEIDKALYELAYERGHRPHWMRIPVRGIARVVERARPR
ncbi:MAG TPA: hypothetical protein VHJ34_06205 [Actinomycetota bacterium]|nr:hypothetical protein [Actinomycetota bacterium]